MYIGIDHGTTAMRFAGEGCEFRISRKDAVNFVYTDLERLCPLEKIEGIALCYSMGDNFSRITRISRLKNRGVVSREGAGEHIGGGTRVFDEIKDSGLPAVAIPGLHRGSPTDTRFKAYSHQASPEKIGIAYYAVLDLGPDVVVSDVSSNTVTLLITGGRITGAFDACIFAPGMQHGALDVDAIRRIDNGEAGANESFLRAGAAFTVPVKDRERTIAMFSAMECAALLLLNPCANVALAGSLAPVVGPEVGRLLGRDVTVYDEWCASRGLAKIAKDVFSGSRSILGIDVDL
ncbi:MAG: methanogenesis marker 12 protein [Methanoregulaceae archaeon]|jgi:putative methanogenesis marker protein 12|nr:methanogenesis marker 12 protein [Methanoregulaceae archaeon]